MKTKATSVQVFEVRLWSKKHFINKGDIKKPKGSYENNVYDGFVTDVKSKKKFFFKQPSQFLKAIEQLYKEAEKK